MAIRYQKDNPSTAFIDSGKHDDATKIAVYVIMLIMLSAGLVLIKSGIMKESG